MTKELNGGCLDEREAFEAWAAKNGMSLKRGLGDEYKSFPTEEAWCAWQARAALASPVADGRFWAPPSSFGANWLTNGAALHPLTVNLVVRFARALAEKMAAAEVKYGYSDGWRDTNWMDECRENLLEHIEKGDPRDVAAYCAFLWHHGESTRASLSTSKQAGEAPMSNQEPTLLQDLHNELYLAQRTESVEVLMKSIGKARLLLARYRDSLAAPGSAIAAREQSCPSCDMPDGCLPCCEDCPQHGRKASHVGRAQPTDDEIHAAGWPMFGRRLVLHELQFARAVFALASREEAPATPQAEPVTEADVHAAFCRGLLANRSTPPAAIPPSTSSFIDTIQPWTMEHLKAYPKAALEILNKRIAEANAAAIPAAPRDANALVELAKKHGAYTHEENNPGIAIVFRPHQLVAFAASLEKGKS